MAIKVGDIVKLKPGSGHVCPKGRANHRTAAVKAVLTDIPGGLYMHRDLRGCRYWNAEDVLKVTP
jgi:hypothetical protein